MKIADSSISMLSNRTYTEKYEVTERLRVWIGNERPDFEGRNEPAGLSPETRGYILDLTSEARDTQSTNLSKAAQTQPAVEAKSSGGLGVDTEFEFEIVIVEKLVEVLTGKKIKVKKIEIPRDCEGNECSQPQESPDSKSQEADGQRRQGWGMEYDYHRVYHEHEKMMFKAKGTVVTADGEEIRFDIKVKMSRKFMEKHDISFRAGDAVKIDPLVINFNGAAAELTDNKFYFDLDADGKKEWVSFLKPGSGFLAIDLNEDGEINNGGELFGPSSGNGFAELAQYDGDGNRWIDENDSVFAKLQIWSRDAQGNNLLFNLKQKNIGAIYLDNIATHFAIKNNINELQGQVASSSIYLKEDGTAGTVQQIDLAA